MVDMKMCGTGKVLYKDDNIEIRKCPPCHRTLVADGKPYFVPLPYQVYITTKYSLKSKTLAMAFAGKKDTLIYTTPWWPPNQAICIDNYYHYNVPLDMDISEIAAIFWSTAFWIPSPGRLSNIFGVRNMQEWSKLTLKQILKRLKYGEHNVADIVESLKRRYR